MSISFHDNWIVQQGTWPPIEKTHLYVQIRFCTTPAKPHVKQKGSELCFFMFRLFFRMIRHTVFTKPPSLALGHKKLHKRFTAKRKCATPFRDGSRISGKGVYMYKGVCGVALLLLSHFS